MFSCFSYRELLRLDDGGVLALDWAANLPAECDKDDAPVLLFLSGITGSSSDNYVKYSMLDGMRHGYRPLVMNYRGCGGINLTVSNDAIITYTIHWALLQYLKRWPFLLCYADSTDLFGYKYRWPHSCDTENTYTIPKGSHSGYRNILRRVGCTGVM